MKITQISIGRFHHFHLARQLERHGLLEAIFTGYPRFKLRDEHGIPPEKINCFPWLQTPYMARGRFGLAGWRWLDREWPWWAHETLDRYAASHLAEGTTVVALSGSGLRAGREAQSRGGVYVCDRGSSHIRYQDQLLREEYRRWGLEFAGIDPRIICKEMAEYEAADRVTVPSEFVRRSFIEHGVPETKVMKISYGANLSRFSQAGAPSKDSFVVLFVGQISFRKGFPDLLQAFAKLRHPRKKLVVIGAMQEEMRSILNCRSFSMEQVEFLGSVPNAELKKQYSTAHVFVLPSIEEGLAMVQGEALACGCPVIASTNTGGSDLFSDGVEGFIVPIRSPEAIAEKLQLLADDPDLRERMSEKALARVKAIGGWDRYGDGYVAMLRDLAGDEL